jgi:hypothetical protein
MGRYRREYEDDDESPRRSSRRRDDMDDNEDRPRRRSRRDYDDDPPAKRASGLGIFSLILGILSLVLSAIPCINIPGGVLGLVGVLLGIIGLVSAKGSNGRVGGGLPLAGLIVAGLAVVTSAVMIFVFFKYVSTLPTTPGVSATGPVDYTLTAVELDREFNQNKFAAESKYKGKVVEVSGTVERVGDDVKKYRLTLELTGFDGMTVDCDFSTTKKSELAALKPGTAVTVRGKCIGTRDDYVTLEDCVIVPAGSKPPDQPTGPAVKVTAEELAKSYDENVVAADEKYKGKLLEVSGTVGRVGDGTPGIKTLAVLSPEGRMVEARFPVADATQLGKLKSGQAVTVTGKCTGGDFGLPVLEGCKLK